MRKQRLPGASPVPTGTAGLVQWVGSTTSKRAEDMIRHVSFRNFKALREVEVPLERLTVIVGPNSSGKTSILQGLAFLLDVASKPADHANRYAVMQLRTKGVTDSLEVSVRLDEGDVLVAMSRSDASAKAPSRKTNTYYGNVHGWDFFVDGREGGETSEWKSLPECPNLAQSLPRSALVRFDASRLAQPHYSEQEVPTLGRDGTGLPSVLASMALTYPDEFSLLQSDLRKVIPAVQRVRLERAQVHSDDLPTTPGSGRESVGRYYVGDALLFDLTGAKSVPAAQVSEGTLLVLGLLTAVHLPPQPNLILLDDLGAGLHPRAQLDLVAVLRQIMEQRPDLQIVATTHSPYLLNDLRPQEVRLTTLKDDGSVACASMTEHPDFPRWKAEFRPGEFWSFIGEKWVANRESHPVEAAS
jgi:energy-coupling factor transporter ATP-binding protein EcfA2